MEAAVPTAVETAFSGIQHSKEVHLCWQHHLYATEVLTQLRRLQ